MSSLKTLSRGKTARALHGAIGLAILATLPGACTTNPQGPELADYDYRKRHPIMISNEPEVLDIPVGMRGPAISAQIEVALRDYTADYFESGTGGVTIQVPTGSANEVAAKTTGHAVHYALVRAGVPRAAIAVAPYYVGNYARTASVRVSFLKVKAVTPKCGIWPERQPNSQRNPQYHNFGCATQNNLAAMVANPADFVRPREMAPANGARRAKVIADYSQGADPKSATALGGGE